MQQATNLPSNVTPGGPSSRGSSQRRTAIRASATMNDVRDVEMNPEDPDSYIGATSYEGESSHI